MISSYCVVKGCDNEVSHSSQLPPGTYLPPGTELPSGTYLICNPCLKLLTDGTDWNEGGETFIHDLLNERDELKKRIRHACVAMDGGGYLSVDDLIQIYCRYYELTKPKDEIEDATSKPLWKYGFSFGYDKGYADAQKEAAAGKPVDDGRFQAYTEGFWRGFDMGYEKAKKV